MYQLTNDGVVRLTDGAIIPADPGNADYQVYLVWLAAGGEPLPVAASSPQVATALKLKQAALVEARPALLQDEILIDDTITIGEWQ